MTCFINKFITLKICKNLKGKDVLMSENESDEEGIYSSN